MILADLQDPGQQVSHCRTVERRDRRISRRGSQSTVLPCPSPLSPKHVGAHRAKLQAISKDVRIHVRRRIRRVQWHGEMKKEAEFLHSQGSVAVIPSRRVKHHRLEKTLAGANAGRLFDGLKNQEGL